MFHQIDGQGDEMVGEEDCLVMNIFTPDLEPDAPFPVMVHMMTLGNFLNYLQGLDPWRRSYYRKQRCFSRMGIGGVRVRVRTHGFSQLAHATTHNYQPHRERSLISHTSGSHSALSTHDQNQQPRSHGGK